MRAVTLMNLFVGQTSTESNVSGSSARCTPISVFSALAAISLSALHAYCELVVSMQAGALGVTQRWPAKQPALLVMSHSGGTTPLYDGSHSPIPCEHTNPSSVGQCAPIASAAFEQRVSSRLSKIE